MAASCDVLILGAGAAGLMCAIQAGRRGRRVIVIEHNARIARKILISGGGRCNFTNIHTRPENFLSANPHFAKSALSRYTPGDFVETIECHGIRYHEKTLGQLFCDRSAADIVSMLQTECDAAGVEIRTSCAVKAITPGFRVATADAEIDAQSVVVATGGLSIPKIGATPFGYTVAAQFGIDVLPCRPALVPLTFSRADAQSFADLAGVSADVIATAGTASFREKMLFTHRGLSGPAILQASSYWSPGRPLTIDLLPQVALAEALRVRRAAGDPIDLRSFLTRHLPKRLAARWCDLNRAPDSPLAAISDREIDRLSAAIHRWELIPSGTEGFEKAEVTAGGVNTAELSSKTFEARKVPGLYFIGEVVDVTGHLGGFNFQWAWASGYSAGQFV
ncbi:MAG TPA: NAD(P)/FAD-dependent oxidoreductase [Candidatus Limnocylindrales bacterium]|nr:NAD(P)/FAD-dependent oxidoreductase [Candidatus Limnocylindrales bacterium]